MPLQDDVATESRAAVVAGVTTWGIHAPSTRMGAPRFVEYVQQEDVVSFHDVIDDFTGVIERDSAVDVFATYMLETDQQAREIPEYARDHGVTSYKLYLQAMSPEAEPNWPGRRAGLGAGFDDGVVYQTMEAVAALGYPGVVAMHCENWEIARIFDERLRAQGRTDWATWSDRSPHFLEAQHVRQYGHFAEYLGCPIYIQHATTPETYREILELRGRGVTCYAQTGPHWLHFGKEEHNAWRINVLAALAREQPQHLERAARRRHQRGRLRPRRDLGRLSYENCYQREHLGAADRLHLARRDAAAGAARRASTRAS